MRGEILYLIYLWLLEIGFLRKVCNLLPPLTAGLQAKNIMPILSMLLTVNLITAFLGPPPQKKLNIRKSKNASCNSIHAVFGLRVLVFASETGLSRMFSN